MNQSLQEQFLKIIETGDEEAAEKFLIAHIQEFSEPLQKKIAFAFLEKTVRKQTTETEAIIDFQKQALAAFDDIEKEERILTDKKKELETREQLGL